MGKKKKNTTKMVDDNKKNNVVISSNNDATTTKENDVENATTLLSEDDENATTLLSEENDDENATTLLSQEDEDENATTLLSEEDENATTLLEEFCEIKDKNVEIVNIVNQEKIKIEKTPFILGSNKEVDCFINNTTVSKKHAIIYFENDNLYIVDNKSTNGTLVEGMTIEPNKKIELYNGNLIQLSNELFQLNIQ